MNKFEASDKIKSLLLLGWTQEKISGILGMKRQTLSSKIKNHNWRKLELEKINQL